MPWFGLGGWRNYRPLISLILFRYLRRIYRLVQGNGPKFIQPLLPDEFCT
ncbi:unnamed protein product [Ectocarpus sp. CCAP 1310/34]|nr:unnamed protein product [Ectocarpus sp. CCAP 1310/34]